MQVRDRKVRRVRRLPAVRWRGSLIALCVLVGLLSGCGGDRLATALVSPAHLPAPGHSSPAGAVAGFFDAAAHNDRSTACGYVPPQSQASCNKVRGLGADLPRAGLILGDTSERGPIALVVLLGRVCLTSSGHRNCLTNQHLRAGLPSGQFSFTQAVHRSLTQADDPATLCVKLHGHWYAALFGG